MVLPVIDGTPLSRRFRRKYAVIPTQITIRKIKTQKDVFLSRRKL